MKQKKHIETSEDSKIDFDKFKSDLSFKLRQRITSNRAIKILLDTYKDYQRLKSSHKRSMDKIHALENVLEVAESK